MAEASGCRADTGTQMQFYESLLDRWLEERSDICGALVALIVGMLSLRGGISSGTTGFLVSTGLECTSASTCHYESATDSNS